MTNVNMNMNVKANVKVNVKFLALGFCTLLLGKSSFAFLQPIVFDPAKGSVEFLAVGHPSALKVRGKGVGPKGELTLTESHQINGELSFDLKSLQTGIEMRDEHMKSKYLHTEVDPLAHLKVTALPVPFDSGRVAATKDAKFLGSLKLNGVEQPVEGQMTIADVAGDPMSEKVTSVFPIQLTKFKVDLPSYAGITIAENVEVTVVSQAHFARDQK